jgi:hypothetical protein
MSRAYSIALLISIGASVAAELLTLIFPHKLLEMVDQPEIRLTWFYAVAGVLSLFYVVAIALLAFSGDRIFGIYAFVFVVLSASVFFAKRHLHRFWFIVSIESAICLVMLLDAGRTIIANWQ